MENYLHIIYKKSPTTLSEVDIHKLSELFQQETGIESFRVQPETIYLEYDSYYYTPKRIEEYLSGVGIKDDSDSEKEHESGRNHHHTAYHKVYSTGKPANGMNISWKKPKHDLHN